MLKKLSIIIPVYNVEKYLNKCLKSCLTQDLRPEEYEIIAVNDGSPDKCGKILEEYEHLHANLTVLTQKNKGLSAARNNGLKRASGKYIWFVDSDDWIEENCLGKIAKSLEKAPDILQLNFQKIDEIKNTVVKILEKHDGSVIMNGKNVTIHGGLPSPAQFSIYRREFLIKNNLKFAEGRLHEDIEFKPRATFLANKIAWHTPIVYNYLIRTSGSITSSFKLKNGEDILYAIKSINDFKNRYAKDELSKQSLNNYIGKDFNTMMKVFHLLEKKDRNILKKMIIKDSSIFDNMIYSTSTKYKIEGLVFKISFYLGEKILQLIKY